MKNKINIINKRKIDIFAIYYKFLVKVNNIFNPSLI